MENMWYCCVEPVLLVADPSLFSPEIVVVVMPFVLFDRKKTIWQVSSIGRRRFGSSLTSEEDDLAVLFDRKKTNWPSESGSGAHPKCVALDSCEAHSSLWMPIRKSLPLLSPFILAGIIILAIMFIHPHPHPPHHNQHIWLW
jgi:hypothetical protein